MTLDMPPDTWPGDQLATAGVLLLQQGIYRGERHGQQCKEEPRFHGEHHQRAVRGECECHVGRRPGGL